MEKSVIIPFDKSIVSKSIDRDISASLYKASFALKYPNMTPERAHITDKYDAWPGVLTASYVYKNQGEIDAK